MKTAISEAASLIVTMGGTTPLSASCPSLDAGEFPSQTRQTTRSDWPKPPALGNVAETLALRSGSRVNLRKFGSPRALVLSRPDIITADRIPLTRAPFSDQPLRGAGVGGGKVAVCFTLHTNLYIIRSKHALKGQRIGRSSASSAARPILSGSECS